MNFTVTTEIKDLIREATRSGISKNLLKNRLQDETGWKDTKCYQTIREVQAETEAEYEAERQGVVAQIVEQNRLTRKAEEAIQYCTPLDITPEERAKLITEYTQNYKDELAQQAKEQLAEMGIDATDREGIVGQLVSDNTASRNELLKLYDFKEEDTEIENNDKYSYNRASDHYIISTKKTKSGFIVLDGNTVRSIRFEYINNNTTAGDLATKYSIPKDCLVDILAKLSVTHDSSEVTDEELKAKSEDELTEELLIKKRFNVAQKLEKEIWKETQSNATKWIEFKHNHFDPFAAMIAGWNPPAHVSVAAPTRQTAEDRAFVVGAFDWHIGSMAESRYLFKGRDWNIAEAKKSIDKYTNSIEKRVDGDAVGFGKCVFLMGGDLYNTLTGYTSGGTQLTSEVIKDTQFEAIMNLLVFFINRMLEIFPKVECHFVRGNHAGTTDIPLAWSIKNYFHKEPRLTFDISSCRTKMVTVGPVLFLLDHGASDEAKAQVPNSGKAKEAYIQSLFLAHPERLVGIKQKCFLMGDLHHFVQEEFNDFEYIMTGALPCGDQYSNALNKRNRPRQNCIIVDKDGIASIEHIYFE